MPVSSIGIVEECCLRVLQCLCHRYVLVFLVVLLLWCMVLRLLTLARQTLTVGVGECHTNTTTTTTTLQDPKRLQTALSLFAEAPTVTSSSTGGGTGTGRHRTEALCRSLLEAMLQMSLPKCRPQWLTNPTTKRALELDMYNADHRLAFEYDGAQHHHYTEGPQCGVWWLLFFTATPLLALLLGTLALHTPLPPKRAALPVSSVAGPPEDRAMP